MTSLRFIEKGCHREAAGRGDLLVQCTDFDAVPGDCRAPLGLAMTAMTCGWSF